MLGLGITYIGQRMKNRTEFFGGIVYFIAITLGFIVDAVTGQVFYIQLLGLIGWVYIIFRVIGIHLDKQNKISVI